MLVIHPGIHDTSCARCPAEKDFGCGFHSACSLGTRAMTSRVGGISSSKSTRKISTAFIPIR